MKSFRNYFGAIVVLVGAAMSGCATVNNVGMQAFSEVPKKPELAAQPLSDVTKMFVANGQVKNEFTFSEEDVRYFQKTGVISRATDVDNDSLFDAGLQGAMGLMGGFANLDPVFALDALIGLGKYKANASRIEAEFLVISADDAEKLEALVYERAVKMFPPTVGKGGDLELFKDTDYSNGYAYTYALKKDKSLCETCGKLVVSKLPRGDKFIFRGYGASSEIIAKFKDDHKTEPGINFWPGLRWNGKVCVNLPATIAGKEVEIPEFAGMCLSQEEFKAWVAKQADKAAKN